jgi:hypothetical protein
MRDNQCCTARQNRHHFRQIGRRQHFSVWFCLAENEQVSIAGLNDQFVFILVGISRRIAQAEPALLVDFHTRPPGGLCVVERRR